LLDTLFLVAAKWPPEYGGPGIYYKRNLRHVAAIADHVRIVAWSRGGAIDLGDAPANVTAVAMPSPRGRMAAHLAGIRLAAHLLGEVRAARDHAGIIFTGGSISIGWRPTALCMRFAGVPVLVENVLFDADDGRALLKARWPSYTRLAANRLRAFCPVSLGLLASLREAFPRAAAVHLPYGVDLEANRPADPRQRAAARSILGVPNSTFVAVSFGAIHQRKGQLPLIDAWLRWMQQSGPADARLFIVGPPSDAAYVEAIQRRLDEVDTAAAATIVCTGFSADVGLFLRAADVYLSAAFAEGLPISIVEALAHGVPVVCRKLEGVTDDFLRGSAVTAVVDWNVDAVARALDTLTNASIKDIASKDARSVAENRFDVRNRIAIIRELLTSDVRRSTSTA
jgi:glycosyltransferase involved in cell wall biosynthesis